MRTVMAAVLATLALSACGAAGDDSADSSSLSDAVVRADGPAEGELSVADEHGTENRPEPPVDPVLGYPHDGRLYAAAGAAVITPDEENHPCPLYMGGTGMNRLAEGTHDDLEARVLILAQDDVHMVLVSMDLVGLEGPDTLRMKARVQKLGLDPGYLVVTCTHTHTGPDSIGVWGPDTGVSGRCPDYSEFLADTLESLVSGLLGKLRPVLVAAGEVPIHEPASNVPSLLADSRQPQVVNNRVGAARLATEEGETVATIVNWHNHPEAMITHNVFSADFPRWTRIAMEQTFGGTCIYFSGTVGGLMTPIDVTVPAWTEEGEPIVAGGAPVMLDEGGPKQAWSLGYVVAKYAQDALDGVQAGEVSLAVEKAEMVIPIDNLPLIITFQSGVLEPDPDLIKDNPDFCGNFGCLPFDMHHVRLGSLHLVSVPGEVFPETATGRPESTCDWLEEFGEPWEPITYPAMEGYRSLLPDGHILMTLGLANREIGYVIPESDLLPANHPDNYEEYFNISPRVEALVRMTVEDLLQ